MPNACAQRRGILICYPYYPLCSLDEGVNQIYTPPPTRCSVCVCVHGDGDVSLHPTAHSLFNASAQRRVCQMAGLHAHSPSNLVTKVVCASVSLCSSMGLRKSCHVTAERAFRHDDIECNLSDRWHGNELLLSCF